MGRGLSLENCIMICSAGVSHQNTKSITPLSQHVGIEKNKRCDLTFIKVSSLIAPLLDDTELTSLSSCSLHLLYQILTSTYQLLNDTLPGCFRDCWFCVPPRPNLWPPIMASPIGLLDSLTSPLINCSEPNIITNPYLSHSFGITDCFDSSGTHLWTQWIL